MELQRKELNECRAEITSLKMHIEGARAGGNWTTGESENVQSLQTGNHMDEVRSVHTETENTKEMNSTADNLESTISLIDDTLPMEKVVEMNEGTVLPNFIEPLSGSSVGNDENQPLGQDGTEHSNITSDHLINSSNGNVESTDNAYDGLSKAPPGDVVLIHKSESPKRETTSEKMVMLVSMHAFLQSNINIATWLFALLYLILSI